MAVISRDYVNPPFERAMTQAKTPDPDTISCDQEAWLKARLRALIITCAQINLSSNVGADENLRNGALEGAINGQAIEIIHTLGLEPCYVNLRKI